VPSQHDSYGFSAPVVFRNKAHCAGNGRTLGKHCNAVAGHHSSALRVSLFGPTDCVVPLDKGVAIACETRLAVNPDKLTELAIIMLGGH
jgi:hypothetical protein